MGCGWEQPLQSLLFLLVQDVQQQDRVLAGNDDKSEDAPTDESGSSPQPGSSSSMDGGGRRQYLDVGLGQVTARLGAVAC